MTHYPLQLTPIYKEMLWGGNRLSTVYNRDLPYKKTGESWDISCRPGEMGIIENGPATGLTLQEYIARDRAGTLGTRLAGQERFPLLIKLIDANDVLSVQVHPDDVYAGAAAGKMAGPIGTATCITGGWNAADTGKTEMWYILIPPACGHLIIGLKPGITRDTLRQAYKDGMVEACLNPLPVTTGDIVNIPAGLVHALTPGAMVAEVQQNSDITYRLYDYNRLGLDGKPRQLHIDDALAVTDFEGKIPKATVPGLDIKKGDCTLTYAIANPYFAIIKYNLKEPLAETSNTAAFSIFTCVKGEAEIISTDLDLTSGACNLWGAKRTSKKTGASPHQISISLPLGRSVFIPAGLGRYTLRPRHGCCTLLKSFVPDIKNDFLAPLRDNGYSDNKIATNTAVQN